MFNLGMFGQGGEGFLPGEPPPGTQPQSYQEEGGWDPWEVGTDPVQWGPGTEYEWQPQVGIEQWEPSEELLADPEYQQAYQELQMREQLGQQLQGQMGSMELTPITDPRTGETRWEWSPVEQLATRSAGVYGSGEEYEKELTGYEGQEEARQERMSGMLEQLGYSPSQMEQARIEFQNQWMGHEPQPGEEPPVGGGTQPGYGGMPEFMAAYNKGYMTGEMGGEAGPGEGWTKTTYAGTQPWYQAAGEGPGAQHFYQTAPGGGYYSGQALEGYTPGEEMWVYGGLNRGVAGGWSPDPGAFRPQAPGGGGGANPYFPGQWGGGGESGTPGQGPGMETGADEEAWGAGEGDQGDW